MHTMKKNDNILLNRMEMKSQKVILQSTPQYVTIGAHYKCNANCNFCLGGDYPPFSLALYKNFFEKKLYPVLQRAIHVGFCGWGEILLHPEILQFLDYANKTLPDTIKVFTTNGIPLKPKVCDKFVEGKYSILISLHAANENLHQFLTRTKSFQKIIENIKYLVKLKKIEPSLHINLIFLVTTMNIENLLDFVKLARELNVDRVTCNYLTMFNPQQIKMSCYFQKEKTIEMFEKAEELSKKLDMTLVLPPRFGNSSNENTLCHDPWEFFYVENQGSVLPCCFAGDHIGYLNKADFEEIWNSDGYVRLRKGLLDNKPYTWCKYCYRYKPSNVDDIRSHITFRPQTQKMIIEYIKSHKEEFGEIPELNE